MANSTKMKAIEHAPRPERPSALVLVRCWLEPRNGTEPALRGHVRDLCSGVDVPIADLKAVEQFLRARLGLGTDQAIQGQES